MNVINTRDCFVTRQLGGTPRKDGIGKGFTFYFLTFTMDCIINLPVRGSSVY